MVRVRGILDIMFSLSRNEFLRETSIIFHITRSHARNKFLCVALLIEPFARVARLLASIPQAEPIFDSLQAKNQILVRVRGIEPLSRVWKTRILTVVLHPLVETCGQASFCLVSKSFGLVLGFSSQNSKQSTSLLGLEFWSFLRRQNGLHFVGLLFS